MLSNVYCNDPASDELVMSEKNRTNDRSFYWYLAPLKLGFHHASRVAPVWTGRVALRLWGTPRRHRSPDRERGWLDTATETFSLTIDGDRVVGWRWGTTPGPTILLVHGWEGRGSQLGAFAQPLVAAGFNVLAFDAPGHGASSGRVSSMPQFARTIVAVSQRFGPLHAIVAHSFGAAASTWAMQSGTKIEKLVLLAPPADLDDFVAFFSDLLSLSEATRRDMVRRVEQRFGIDWQLARRTTITPVPGVSVLVVHDDTDRDSPSRNGHLVASVWPGARLTITSGLGHRRLLREPAVVEEVMAFLVGPPIAITSSSGDHTVIP